MKTLVKTLVVVCLLLICVPAVAQPDILSAVPADAYGFVATKNLQDSYDKIMAFAQAMGIPVPNENKLLAIQEHLGKIDLNGPAALVLLDPQKFSGKPFTLLFSAADAKSILESHKAKAQEESTTVELPAGVIAGAGGYLAVKDGFVVFATEAQHVAAVLASQTPFETMPAVKAAFDNGQIVLAGDLQRAGPWIVQMLNAAQAKMAAQMAMASGPQAAQAKDMFSMYLNLAQGLIEQCDKLMATLDITADRAILTKRVLFKPGSAAAFMNSQMGQRAPSYSALPGGPFLLAGGVNMATEEFQSLTESFLDKFMNLPSLKGGLTDEQMQQYMTDLKVGIAQLSGYSFTFNLGNPMTGMLNIVGRYDVSDAASYREIIKKMSSGEVASMWSKTFGMPVEYVYTSAAETYSGVAIDTIKMQMTPSAEGAEAFHMTAQQMQQGMAMMYGPDMTFRLAAPTDKQVLFTMGGGAEQMERAINVAQGNGSVLADETAIKMGTANLPAERFAEAHLNIGQVMPMIMAMMGGAGQPGAMPPPAATGLAPVSLSCSAEANTFRADVVVPAATIKSLVDTLGPMFGPRPGSEAEPEPPSEEFEE